MPPYRLPLSADEFYDALEKGHGRAVQHLRAHGDHGMEEELRDAFVLDYRYDLQTHEVRAAWLCNMLAFVRDPALYRDAVTAALAALKDPLSWHVDHLCELERRFAKDGNSGARAALEAAVERIGVGWRELLLLEGAGVLPRLFAIWEKLDGDCWNLMSAAEEIVGPETAASILEAEVKHSTPAARLQAELQLLHNENTSPRAPVTIEWIKANIEAGSHQGVMMFGRTASDEDLTQLFQWLLRERRPDQIHCLLWVFRLRKPPDLADRLFELAVSHDERIRYHARVALGHWTAGRVRDLGLQILESQAPGVIEKGMLDLLIHNLQPGDASGIEGRLPRSPSESHEDDMVVHDISEDLIQIAEANGAPELAGCLLWVYERTPCGVCQRSAVKELRRRDALPAYVLQECADDAEPETRALVASWSA